MRKQIEKYLDSIYSEIREKYSDEFNLDTTDFRNYTIFDFVNFHLIYQYVIDDKEKKDFFIGIPEFDYSKSFFNSIFQSLVYIKLFQNYFSYEKTNPPIERGDLVYLKKKNRIYKVLKKTPSGLKLNFRFPKKNEIGAVITMTGCKFTKINPNLSNGRNTSNNIDNYARFLRETFSGNFPFITDFKNRTLVIADKRFFRESKYLSIRYTNRNGRITKDLPFFNYMIECCNDFGTAQNYILKNDQTFDEIIIIGDPKYRDNFDTIIQETKFRGKAKNIILIGDEKPNTQNEFTEWLWSNDEVKIANGEEPNAREKILLNNQSLYDTLIKLKTEIKNIRNEINVDLSFILKYTNFYFRLILVHTPISKGIFSEYLDRLNNYFKRSEKFEEELNNLFYDNDIYNSGIIKDYKKGIFEIFSELSSELQAENLKWNYIKQKANERELFLIVEKRSYDAVQNQIKSGRITNINLISDKRIDKQKAYLDKWLNSAQNSKRKLLIIPYLNDYNLYAKLKSIKGDCEVLCYKDIDEISFDRLVKNYENSQIKRLTHDDRQLFFETDFKYINEIKERELDDLFVFDLSSSNSDSHNYERVDLPKEINSYQITFLDYSSEIFESNKGVFLIENGDLIKTTIGEVYEGATIRFYQNNSPEVFRKILKIFDTENKLELFDMYSDSWKNTLGKLKNKYGDIERLYRQLFSDKNKINYNTFRLYFDQGSQTRFPRIRKLEAIRDFCESRGFSDEPIVTNFDKFRIYSKKDHSIKQQAGKILGSDLLDYVASNKTEVSDSLQKLSPELLEKLTETIIEKTVAKKELLENE
jgi:hypothetical protein